VTGATIQCLSHSANPAIEFGAGRVNRTLVGEVQALCTATVLDQQNLELARSLELRSGAYRAPALPVELYQRSWCGDSNADHGLTWPALFPLSYTSTFSSNIWRRWGELHSRLSALQADALLSWLHRLVTDLLTWSGRRDSNPRSRRWQRRVLATRRLPL
jgi:hypothetical protein